MAAHSSVLAWRISWAEEPGGLQSMGHRESDTTEATMHAWLTQCISLLLCFFKSVNLSVTIILLVCSLVSPLKALTFIVHFMSQTPLLCLLGWEAPIYSLCLTETNGT